MTFPIPQVRLKNPDNDFFRVLRRARRRINRHENQFICNAMRDSGGTAKHVELIEQQIGGHATFDSWMLDHTTKWSTDEDMREARLVWIDSMLSQEYK